MRAADTESTRHAAIIDRLAQLATPVALLFVLGVQRFSLQNGVDPFIYVGYQMDTHDLVSRYGWQYFAVRFGLLWPAHLCSVVFGIVPGYFVLRYLLALLALAPLVALGRSHGSRLAGWAAGLVCLASPIFIGAVMTVYADTVGLPCLIAGCALILRRGDHGCRRSLAAGVLFGCAFNANLFIALPLLGGFGLRALLQVARGQWRQLVEYLFVAAGVTAVTLVGAIGYRIIYGTFDVLGPSFEALRKYSGSAGSVFRQNNHEWLRIYPHLYIPPIVALCLLALIVTRRREPGESRWRRWSAPGAADALLMLVGVMTAYLLQQFVLKGYSFETFFYFSYSFAFTTVAVVMIFVELADRGGPVVVAAGAVTAVAAPLLRNAAFKDLQLWVLPWVPVLAVVVVGLAILTRRWPGSSIAAAVALTAVVGALAFSPPKDVPVEPGQSARVEPHYEATLGNSDERALNIYEASAEFDKVVPKWNEDPGTTIYWYNSGSALLNAAQATQYWRTVALQELHPGGAKLTKGEARQLGRRTPRHLVILSESVADRALRVKRVSRVVNPLTVVNHVVGPAEAQIYVAVLTLEPARCDSSYRAATPWLELPPCR